MFRLAGSMFAAFVLLSAAPASAHLMSAKQGTLNILDDSIYSVVSIPVSTLHGYDDNGDGVMQMTELRQHVDELRAEIGRRYVIRNNGATGETVSLDLVLSPEHGAANDRASQVVALVHVRFPSPVTAPGISYDLFGVRPEDRQITFTTTRHDGVGPQEEKAVLSPNVREHSFFQSRRERAAMTLRGWSHRPAIVLALILGSILASAAIIVRVTRGSITTRASPRGI